MDVSVEVGLLLERCDVEAGQRAAVVQCSLEELQGGGWGRVRGGGGWGGGGEGGGRRSGWRGRWRGGSRGGWSGEIVDVEELGGGGWGAELWMKMEVDQKMSVCQWGIQGARGEAA